MPVVMVVISSVIGSTHSPPSHSPLPTPHHPHTPHPHTQHVEPLRSFSKTRLFTGSNDNVRSHTLSTSISKSPYHSVNPTQSLPVISTNTAYPPPNTSSPAHASSTTDPSSSDGENFATTDPAKSKSDEQKFMDSEERDRKEPLDVNMTV